MATIMSIIITTMMRSAAADMTTIMSIIITTMTSVAADMTTIMSIIITTMMTNVAADIIMIITTITQTKYLPAGDVRLLRSLQEKGLRKCWRAFPLLKSMA